MSFYQADLILHMQPPKLHMYKDTSMLATCMLLYPCNFALLQTAGEDYLHTSTTLTNGCPSSQDDTETVRLQCIAIRIVDNFDFEVRPTLPQLWWSLIMMQVPQYSH